MDEIIIIKSNGFIEVLSSDIDLKNYDITLETLGYSVEKNEDGIYKIHDFRLRHDEGQEGDYGRWEVEPYYEIVDEKVTKLCDIDGNYRTNAEKQDRRDKAKIKRVERLQEFVRSFGDETGRYDLCKVWRNDRLALRSVTGNTFSIFHTIHEFDNDSMSYKNLKEIKLWIVNYFESLKQGETPNETKNQSVVE